LEWLLQSSISVKQEAEEYPGFQSHQHPQREILLEDLHEGQGGSIEESSLCEWRSEWVQKEGTPILLYIYFPESARDSG
jgi:hypothetical protein